MTKGTPSFGKRNKKPRIRCRRCGRVSYHKQLKKCSACGFGKTPRIQRYRWSHRTLNRTRTI